MKKAMFATLAQLTLGLIGLLILSFFLHMVSIYVFSGFDHFYMGVEDYPEGLIKSIILYVFTCILGVVLIALFLGVFSPFIIGLFSLVDDVYRANKRK